MAGKILFIQSNQRFSQVQNVTFNEEICQLYQNVKFTVKQHLSNQAIMNSK